MRQTPAATVHVFDHVGGELFQDGKARRRALRSRAPVPYTAFGRYEG